MLKTVDDKWPPNSYVESITIYVIMENQRESSFIEAAYWIFFFFFLVILWDQNGYHIFIKLKKKQKQKTDFETDC